MLKSRSESRELPKIALPFDEGAINTRTRKTFCSEAHRERFRVLLEKERAEKGHRELEVRHVPARDWRLEAPEIPAGPVQSKKPAKL